MRAGPPGETHFIEWIFLLTEEGELVDAVHLDPNRDAEAVLRADIPIGDRSYIPYCFCNKHGLWKGDPYTPNAAA